MATDIFGVSGREMMAALLAGERDPKALAQLARARMRAKIALLEEAFVGHFTNHHAFLLRTMLARVDQASADIASVEARIEELIVPFARAVATLDEIPGVGLAAARRRGKKKAIVAVGRSILVIIWHLLSDPEAHFHDLGSDFHDNRTGPDRKKRNHVRQLTRWPSSSRQNDHSLWVDHC